MLFKTFNEKKVLFFLFPGTVLKEAPNAESILILIASNWSY